MKKFNLRKLNMGKNTMNKAGLEKNGVIKMSGKKDNTAENDEDKKKKRGFVGWGYAKVALIAGAVCFASIGGVSAYLTDHASTTNEFTVGKVDIDLEEPHWNPDDQTKIEPGKVITKDPQIKNSGVNDAYVYLEVSIPIAEVEAANEDGTRLGKKKQELFSFNTDETWTLLKSAQNGNVQVYTYAYNKVLKPGETTKTLFDEITFLNIIEGQLEEQKLEVPVRSYAIQASYTGGTDGTVADRARIAFQKYINQNVNQDGQAAGI